MAHEWLLSASGADKVCAEIVRTLEQAGHEVLVVTALLDPKIAADLLSGVKVIPLWVNRLPGIRQHWKPFAPAIIAAWSTIGKFGLCEEAKTFNPDVIVSNTHFSCGAVAHAFDVPHIRYCQSPLRYAWRPDLENDRLSGIASGIGKAVRPLLKKWDRRVAQRTTLMIANSRSIADRITSSYGLASTVIHPGVDTDRFEAIIASVTPKHYLCFGRLVGYKRTDLVIEACNKAKVSLVVAGDGPDLDRLKTLAGPTIRFAGGVTDAEYRDLLRDSKALIFAGEEDFGIVPVEAMAAGIPVIGFACGGLLDTVIDGVTGTTFAYQHVDSLVNALERHDAASFDVDKLRAHARGFSNERFRNEFLEAFDQVMMP